MVGGGWRKAISSGKIIFKWVIRRYLIGAITHLETILIQLSRELGAFQQIRLCNEAISELAFGVGFGVQSSV